MSKTNLLRGTALLTLTGLIVKVMGAIYRIPLSRLIGEEGMGLYQMAYPIYLVFVSASTAGLPVAISKLVAEGVAKDDLMGVRRLLRISFTVLSLMGMAGSLLMALGAPFFSQHLSADPRSVWSMMALAPAVTLMAMIAALRGYFQGWQNMRPSGWSQMIEQGVRVIILLSLAFLLLPKGIEWAAAGAAFGATAGAIAALIYLVVHYLRFRPSLGRKHTGIGKTGGTYSMWLKRLSKIALPIAFGSILMPLMQTVDSLIVPGMLRTAGYSISQATSALGQLGNAWAVLYLPLIVTSALSAGLVPAMAEAVAKHCRRMVTERLQDGYRVASWVLPAASVGLLVMGEDIYTLIFAGRPTAILKTLSLGVFCLGWQQVSAGILQGMGRPIEPLRHFALGCFVKTTLTLILASRPQLGIDGAAIATVFGSAATVTLNLWTIYRVTQTAGWFKAQAIPGIAAGIMGVSGVMLRLLLGSFSFYGTILTLSIMSIIYLGVLWILGGINRGDIEGFRRQVRIARQSGA